jgi:hypothetical protein
MLIDPGLFFRWPPSLPLSSNVTVYKIYDLGKFVAVSGRKGAVKVPKMFNYGRRKLFLKIPTQTRPLPSNVPF